MDIPPGQIKSGASLGDSADIASGVQIKDGVTAGTGLQVGEDSQIKSYVVIGNDVTLGSERPYPGWSRGSGRIRN